MRNRIRAAAVMHARIALHVTARGMLLRGSLALEPSDVALSKPTAAGDYLNQHPTGDGLPFWSEADRDISDTEIVAWYVFAHNHVPRPEDWPVMPVGSIGFQLKPDGFVDRSPAMDVPPPSEKCKTNCC